MVAKEDMTRLEQFIDGARPDERGEVDMYCPLHPDSRRSASLNVERSVWYCHAGCGGGSVKQLIDSEDLWIPMDERGAVAIAIPRPTAPRSSIDKVDPEEMDWLHSRLLGSDRALKWLADKRGLEGRTVRRARLGFDGRRYKIPVYDSERRLVNIRTYDPQPGKDRRKIWGVRGHNRPMLYPVSVLDRAEPGSSIIVCEGEWDALLAIQTGYQAITRTGSATTWDAGWAERFEGLRVFLCHDADDAGAEGDQIVGRSLDGLTVETRVIELPFRRRTKHGLDLTDFILDEEEPGLGVGRLMETATPFRVGATGGHI